MEHNHAVEHNHAAANDQEESHSDASALCPALSPVSNSGTRGSTGQPLQCTASHVGETEGVGKAEEWQSQGGGPVGMLEDDLGLRMPSWDGDDWKAELGSGLPSCEAADWEVEDWALEVPLGFMSVFEGDSIACVRGTGLVAPTARGSIPVGGLLSEERGPIPLPRVHQAPLQRQSVSQGPNEIQAVTGVELPPSLLNQSHDQPQQQQHHLHHHQQQHLGHQNQQPQWHLHQQHQHHQYQLPAAAAACNSCYPSW